MFTVPILVLALAGQAPVTTPPEEKPPQTEQAQPADGAAAEPAPSSATDPNAAPDPAQTGAQNPVQPGQKPPSKADLKEPPTPEHTGIHALFGNLLEDFKHLPSNQNLLLVAGGGALAMAAHPADIPVNNYMVDHFTQFNAFFAAGKYIGDTPEQIAGAIATYAWGRFRDEPKVSHFGMDLLQAQIMAEILFNPIKLATQRERPDGSDHLSFPSGHATVTFATATVIERHLGWRKSLLAYAIASYVAASRLHDNRHYVSDVVFGAATGIIIGRSVTWHGRNFYASPMLLRDGAGIQLALAH